MDYGKRGANVDWYQGCSSEFPGLNPHDPRNIEKFRVDFVLLLCILVGISCSNSLKMRNVSDIPVEVEIVLSPNNPYVVSNHLTITVRDFCEVFISIHDWTVYEFDLEMQTPEGVERIILNSEEPLVWKNYTIESHGFMNYPETRIGLRIIEMRNK